jgi:hypothetical protein
MVKIFEFLITGFVFMWFFLLICALVWKLTDCIRTSIKIDMSFIETCGEYMCIHCGHVVSKQFVLEHKCGRRPE